MPSYNFGDADNAGYSPEGDYIVQVMSVDFGISAGQKTCGSDKMDLKLLIESTRTTLHEFLILHHACEWKIDTFVKSTNLLVDGKPPVKGQSIDFTERMLIGLRGWARLSVDKKDPAWPRNSVFCWITNKEKLPKASIETNDFE